MRILENQCLAYAHSLAIDAKDLSARLVFDPEVIANRDKLLAHLVAIGIATAAKGLPLLLSFLSSAT
jgi:hypothetical protein